MYIITTYIPTTNTAAITCNILPATWFEKIVVFSIGATSNKSCFPIVETILWFGDNPKVQQAPISTVSSWYAFSTYSELPLHNYSWWEHIWATISSYLLYKLIIINCLKVSMWFVLLDTLHLTITCGLFQIVTYCILWNHSRNFLKSVSFLYSAISFIGYAIP